MRAGNRGGRPFAALLAMVFGLVLPVLFTVQAAGPAQASRADHGGPTHRSKAAPCTAAAATNDPYPYSRGITAEIDGITPTVIGSKSGNLLTVTGTITNSTDGPIYDLRYVFQRGEGLSTVAAVKAEITNPGRPDAVVGQSWKVLGATATTSGMPTEVSMSARTSLRFVATVPISSADGLLVADRGVYPLMIKVSGDVGTNGCVQYERVGEFHLLATVLSVPASVETAPAGAASVTGADGPASTGSGPAAAPAPTALNMIWPIVDAPHVGVSGIFLNDDLAAEISPGGRLYTVLSALRQVDPGPSATTIVVDPELLTEIEHMSTGYRVLSARGHPQSALTATTPSPNSTAVSSGSSAGTASVADSGGPAASTPTTPAKVAPRSSSSAVPAGRPAGSTPSATRAPVPRTPAPTRTTPRATPKSTPTPTVTPTPTPTSSPPTTPVLAPPDPTVAGTGQPAAITYLAALRTAVAGRQVLVLPYSDPDAVAMVRAGLSRQLSSLVTQGRQVAAKVLGLGPITAPGQPGLVTTMSMPAGGLVDDATLAVLSNNGMPDALLSPRSLQHAGGAVGAVTIDETGNGGRPVNAAVTDADVLSMLDTFVGQGRRVGLAVRTNTLAAVLAGANFDGSATPLILTQSNRWTPNVSGLQLLTGLLRAMEAGGVLAATTLPAIAGMATAPATVTYPDDAQQDELDPGYLSAVGRDYAWLGGVRGSLAQAKGPLTLDPADLLDPLSTAMEATMSAAFRSNGRTGSDILRSTEATLGQLRDQVKIATGTTYTLAASTSPLLINVRNDLPYVVTVRVVIRNAQSVGMTATDPGPLSIPAGQSRQFKIATKVVKAGKFPVQVQLLAADGSSWSDPSTITVRSSAYGALTVILIIVAGGALFLMVALRIVQRIRARNRNGGGSKETDDPARERNPAETGTSTDDAVDPPGPPQLGSQGSEGEGKR